jgi:hypothetical protein
MCYNSLDMEKFFNRWMVIGPFDEDFDRFDEIIKNVNPNKAYNYGVDGAEIGWHDCRQRPVDFAAEAKGTYLLANFVYSRLKLSLNWIGITSGNLELLLNGNIIERFENLDDEEFCCNVELRHGWSLLIAKCNSNRESWNFGSGLVKKDGTPEDEIWVKTAFILPDNYDSHMFGKNPDDAEQGIELGDIETEWQKSNPDILVYKPVEGNLRNDGDNEHFLVIEAPKSKGLIAFWTQGKVEPSGDNHIVLARSKDGGSNWTEPEWVTGTRLYGTETQASWGFPVVARDTGRIYCFYTKADAGILNGTTGVMGTMQSDDEGKTWRHGPDIKVPTCYTDKEKPDFETGKAIVWQLPIRDSKDRQLTGYSRWLDKPGSTGSCYLMRFDNIDSGPELEDLHITWLPDNQDGIFMPQGLKDRNCSEPSIVKLPDNRLFMVFRNCTGYIWYSISDDDGYTWRPAEVLRYKDNGIKVKHPLSSCPLYQLKDGRYILIYNNNSYYADRLVNNEPVPAGMGRFTHRRPCFMTVGEFMPEAYQPIWFTEPKEFLDNGGVLVSPKASNEIATYPSLTEYQGRRILWYPDRKYYLLGKIITDEFLSDMTRKD